MCDIELISMLIDGELPEDESARLRAHLEECPSCGALYSDFAALKKGFAELEAAPPDTLAPGIMYKYGLGEGPSRKRRALGSLISVAAVAAVLLVVTNNDNIFPAPPENNMAYYNDNSEPAYDLLDNGVLPSAIAPRTGAGASEQLNPGEPAFDSAAREGEFDSIYNDPVPEGIPAPEAAPRGLYDYSALLGQLDGYGWRLEELDSYGGVLSAESNIISVNGERLEVYEYLSVEAMETEAGYVDPDGLSFRFPENEDGEARLVSVQWESCPHFFKRDLIIVQYVGHDEGILNFLGENFGQRFAGACHLD
jgi:hypothetical protein